MEISPGLHKPNPLTTVILNWCTNKSSTTMNLYVWFQEFAVKVRQNFPTKELFWGNFTTFASITAVSTAAVSIAMSPLRCRSSSTFWRDGDSPWNGWKVRNHWPLSSNQMIHAIELEKNNGFEKRSLHFLFKLLVLGYQHLLLTKFQSEIYGLGPPPEPYCRIFPQVSEVVPSFYFGDTYHP